MKNKFDINNLVRPCIKSLKPYASARDEYKETTGNMVFLDANENPFETGLNRYPDPQQTKVKEMVSNLKGVKIEHILLGNGSDEVLDLIFRAFCEPNKDEVIILPPTYGMYTVLANMNAVGIKKIELDHNFQPKVDDIINAVNSNSKIIFLCSPNNPTANSFEAAHIENILLSFKGIVVIDEAYIDFSTHDSWLDRLTDFPNLIITQTFSKAYGMAGIRLGIGYASKEIIAILNSIKPPYNVNELTQLKAVEKLKNLATVTTDIMNILAQRKSLMTALQNVAFVHKVYPTDANFILVKVDDANSRYKQLIGMGVVVRNRTNEPLCKNCLRFTVGTEEENNKLISIINTL